MNNETKKTTDTKLFEYYNKDFPFFIAGFKPPFRLGKTNKRSILDSEGMKLLEMPKTHGEAMASEFVLFLNSAAYKKAKRRQEIINLIKEDEEDGLYGDVEHEETIPPRPILPPLSEPK